MNSQTIEGFLISPQQSCLWKLGEMGGQYLSSCQIVIQGQLDRGILQETLRRIVRQHSILRTTFQTAPGLELPLQFVSDNDDFEWKVISLDESRTGEQEKQLQVLLQQENHRPFSLSGGPLFRAVLFACEPSRYTLLLVLPALCADSATLVNLFREMASVYTSLRQGEDPRFESIQYLQFSEWLSERTENLPSEKEIRADGITPLLPGESRAETPAAFEPRELTVDVAGPLNQRIEAVLRAYALIPSAFWFAAWRVFLWRLGSLNKMAIGYGCEGREYEEIKPILGPCHRYVPLSVGLRRESTLLEVIESATRRISDLENEDLFLWKSSSFAGARGSVLFDFEEWPHQRAISGTVFSIKEKRSSADGFRLKLVAASTEQGTKLSLCYDRSAFAESTIEEFSRCFAAFVEDAVKDPTQNIEQIAILCETDRKRLLVDLNRTDQLKSHNPFVHELFSAQAARIPEAVALECGMQVLSFADLDRRSGQIARYLTEHAIGPDKPVAVCMQRSAEMIVALLGILKAGGAYLPLSTAEPKERLAFILQDADVSIVLTKGKEQDLSGLGVATVDMEKVLEESRVQEFSAPLEKLWPDNLAYIIYTSGSTGAPKGVLVTHRGLNNYLQWCLGMYGITAACGAPLHSPITSDLSVTTLFATLLAGKRIVIVPESSGPEAVLQMAPDKDFSFVKLTPSHLDMFNTPSTGSGISLATRALIVGGEALIAESLTHWRKRTPELRIFNEYGPTEAAVGCCVFEVPPGSVPSGPIPIGRPIINTQLYILDPNLEPVPTGVTGELYIGGAGLARGYLKRFALTAELFVPNPFAEAPGARLYKTGDLARFRPDGVIEYLGRGDSQVKVRGYRVELGEVEAVLRRNPEVSEVAVLLSDVKPKEKQLVAFVVSRQKPGPPMRELRRYLLERLPDYMVPGRFVLLDRIPLTPNGKIDRKALLSFEASAGSNDLPYVPPRDLTEELLASIWADVLGLDQVGVQDNFFSVGGDSIRAIQVRARAQQRGLNISQQQVFEHQTIRSLAFSLPLAKTGEREVPRTLPFEQISEHDHGRIPLQSLEDAYPLSRLQEGMLFHSELEPESAVYHDMHSFHLRLPFDEGKLRQAIRDMVERHPLLRTSFDLSTYSRPLQLVHRKVENTTQVVDLRHLSGEALQLALHTCLEEEKHRKFAWHEPPLVRFAVLRRTNQTIQFVMCFQHSILDGWSAATLLASLFNHYSALLRGDRAALPTVSASFRDFVAAEQEALASAGQRQFWELVLQGLEPGRLRRILRQRDDRSTRRSALLAVDISEDLSRALHKSARALSVPIKSVLLAAHMRVMKFLTGKSDVVTGIVASGRRAEDDGDSALGLFLNVLPLRLSIRPGPWQQLINDTFEAERQMLPFRRFPLAELKNMFGGRELFETVFNFMHYHVYNNVERVSDAEVLDYSGYEETNFPLTANFSMEPATSNVHLHLNYLAHEFTPEQIAEWGECYLRVLEAIAGSAQAGISTLQLLSGSERSRLLSQGRGDRLTIAAKTTIGALFQAQAQRTPDAMAMTSEASQWSYSTLDQWTNQLARYLQKRGVGPEVVVAVAIDRSPELIISLLAILKAGGTYLPLNLGEPGERLALMIREAGCPLAITREHGRVKLEAARSAEGFRIVSLDAEQQTIAEESQASVTSDACADNLAYIIYTSGSTGHPKGVAVTHRGVLRLVCDANYVALNGEEVVLQFAPASFDASTFEIWGSLLNGAHLVVFPSTFESLEQFEQMLQLFNVTTLWLTAGLFHRICRERIQILEPVRQLLAGGDVLSPAMVSRVLRELPACQLINGYGPTECTTFACAHNARRSGLMEGNSVPIGKPIANTEAYVLDEDMELSAFGVPGELYLGGDGLARGYLRKPDLTAERFVPNPFDTTAGARLYRTGDVVSYSEDGSLQFVGRKDEQVKIRGFRVETAEVQEVILLQPGVRDVVVLAEGEPANKRLVAFWTGEESLAEPELRELLRKALPEYMVPAVMTRVPSIPLTSNGKADRKQLAAALVEVGDHQPAFVAPRTATEKALAELWAEALNLQQVGLEDNFFSLGGHSLIAIQVVSRIRSRFGLELPLGDLFELRTVAALAGQIDRLLADHSGHDARQRSIVPRKTGGGIATHGVSEIDRLIADIEQLSDEKVTRLLAQGAPVSQHVELFPLSYSQQQIWNSEQVNPGSFVLPSRFRLHGSLHLLTLERSVQEIIRRHEALRTVFTTSDGHAMQLVSGTVPLQPVPKRELSSYAGADSGEKLMHAIREEAQAPFDLSCGPLMRISLVRLGETDHMLLLTMHLIISDGWSLNLFMHELATLYAAFYANEPSPLPELPIQLVDYALWERGADADRENQALLAFWRDQFSPDPPALELPTDRPRQVITPMRGGSVALSIRSSAVAAARQFCIDADVTLFMFAAAVFNLVLWESTGQTDLTVGIPHPGRNRQEIQSLIGSFANTLVLRAQLSGDMTFRQHQANVRKVVLDAYAHAELPYAKLVSMLRPGTLIKEKPLFRVMIDLQMENEAQKIPVLPGLTVDSVPPPADDLIVGNDITFVLQEHDKELNATFRYKLSLFEENRVRGMLLRFCDLFEQVLQQPELTLMQLKSASPIPPSAALGRTPPVGAV